MSTKKRYTLTVFTEDKVGLVNRITIIFTRRKLNIESLTASESEVKGVYRFTIVINTIPEYIEKIVGQIEKQIDVIRCFAYEDEEIIFQELAIYKVATSSLHEGIPIEQIVRDNYARILTIDPEFLVIEKTGHEHEIQELYEKLIPYGVLGFARSGRVAITRNMLNLSSFLHELEQKNTDVLEELY